MANLRTKDQKGRQKVEGGNVSIKCGNSTYIAHHGVYRDVITVLAHEFSVRSVHLDAGTRSQPTERYKAAAVSGS